MSEETKELLHCIETNCKHNKCFGSVKLDKEECKLLLDDITNLQQENKKLTSLCVGHEKELRTKDIIIKQIRMEANDYESRCEKANTYINEEIKKIQKHQYSTGVRRLNKIQNILNRSDEK